MLEPRAASIYRRVLNVPWRSLCDYHKRMSVALAAALLAASLYSWTLVPEASAQEDSASDSQPELDHAPNGQPYAAGELVILFEDNVGPRPLEAVGAPAAGLQKTTSLPDVNAAVVRASRVLSSSKAAERTDRLLALGRELRNKPGVAAVEFNYWLEPTAATNDPGLSRQYGMSQINAPRAWRHAQGRPATKIAVVDTGIISSHPDLRAKIARQRDFVNDDFRAEETGNNRGHGTHVAGTAAAVTNNGRGIAGACPRCELHIAKALDPNGGRLSNIVQAINWSANRDSAVINMSFGSPAHSATLERAVNRARELGSLPVAAAGNNGDNTVIYPARYPSVVAVAATNENDSRASYSNKGGWIDVAAPGSRVLSTFPEPFYTRLSGTSFASPHVTGAAGLLASKGLPPNRIQNRLEATAVDKGPAGDDRFYGAGRINAYRAVR